MDVDGFLRTNEPVWQRLEELTRRAGRSRRRLRAGEVDELVRLYERTATHLSLVLTRYDDPALAAQLSRLVSRAGAVVYGTRPRTLRAAATFVADTFPAALWRARHFVLVATALFLLPAIMIAAWLAGSPAALEAAAPPAAREAYVQEDFAAYYSSLPSVQFAALVTTNNIQVAFLAFAGGILLCLPTAVVLLVNGANLGFAAGLFGAVGELARFVGLVAPHGLLELTGVFVAGGAGLRLGWTLVDPGDRRRGEALVEEGRRAVVIVVGLVAVFAVAGLIEGFVTGAPLPTAVRVAIGLSAEAAFVGYVVGRGRLASERGVTGELAP